MSTTTATTKETTSRPLGGKLCTARGHGSHDESRHANQFYLLPTQEPNNVYYTVWKHSSRMNIWPN